MVLFACGDLCIFAQCDLSPKFELLESVMSFDNVIVDMTDQVKEVSHKSVWLQVAKGAGEKILDTGDFRRLNRS